MIFYYLQKISLFFTSFQYPSYHIDIMINPLYRFIANNFVTKKSECGWCYDWPLFLNTHPVIIENSFLFFQLQVFLEGFFYSLGAVPVVSGNLFSLYYAGGNIYTFLDYWYISIPTFIMSASFSFFLLSFIGFFLRKILLKNTVNINCLNRYIFVVSILVRPLPVLGFFSAIVMGVSNISIRRKILYSIFGSVYLGVFILFGQCINFYNITIGSYQGENIFLIHFLLYIQIVIIFLGIYFSRKKN